MKKLLLALGLLFFGCELTPELELTETYNQLSRTLPTQISVVGEVFTYSLGESPPQLEIAKKPWTYDMCLLTKPLD